MPEPASLLETDRVTVSLATRLDRFGGDEAALARRQIERLDPQQWPLEWHLPWWLAQDLGLDDSLALELVEANVLGMAALRLRDDSLDGELDGADEATARRTSDLLLDAALAPYRRLFAPASPFWRRYHRLMSDWQAAHAGRVLAARAAPLKIPAVAIAYLIGRPQLVRDIERCLEHALTAMVLHDQAFDWQRDLDAGRWNAFVAALSRRKQLPANRGRIEVEVTATLMTGTALATHYDRVAGEFSRSIADSRSLGLPTLAGNLEQLAARIQRHAEQTVATHHRLGQRAFQLIFGAQANQ